jgi:hypothetical protein
MKLSFILAPENIDIKCFSNTKKVDSKKLIGVKPL